MNTVVPGLRTKGSASWNGSVWQSAFSPSVNVIADCLITTLLSGFRVRLSKADHVSGSHTSRTSYHELIVCRQSRWMDDTKDSCKKVVGFTKIIKNEHPHIAASHIPIGGSIEM